MKEVQQCGNQSSLYGDAARKRQPREDIVAQSTTGLRWRMGCDQP
jgi:hypothetical protein